MANNNSEIIEESTFNLSVDNINPLINNLVENLTCLLELNFAN